MKPPFILTPLIFNLCTDIVQILGQCEGMRLLKPEPILRKNNRLKTIQSSLAIEGNTLEIEQVTAILEGKRVLGSQKEIIEVQNAIRAYDQISFFKPFLIKSFCDAHRILMSGLVEDAGKWRSGNVGVFQGTKIAHAAPQAKFVAELMEKLFHYVKSDKQTHPIVLSAVFHYEVEFIHPFSDSNGRVGRLWQTTMLSHFHPLFEFTPVESAIREHQPQYYKALSSSDKKGISTDFIEFSMKMILEALKQLKSEIRAEPIGSAERLFIAKDHFKDQHFSRKDYLILFKTLSTATASRDLSLGVKKKIIVKTGEKATSSYKFK